LVKWERSKGGKGNRKKQRGGWNAWSTGEKKKQQESTTTKKEKRERYGGF